MKTPVEDDGWRGLRAVADQRGTAWCCWERCSSVNLVVVGHIAGAVDSRILGRRWIKSFSNIPCFRCCGNPVGKPSSSGVHLQRSASGPDRWRPRGLGQRNDRQLNDLYPLPKRHVFGRSAPREGAESHLILVLHHAISDGLSGVYLLRDVLQRYESSGGTSGAVGRPVGVPTFRGRYSPPSARSAVRGRVSKQDTSLNR